MLRKKQVPYKEGNLKDIGARVRYIESYKAGFEDNVGWGANMLLSGGTDMLGDGNALMVSRVGSRPLLYGGRHV